jgi:cellulose synthase/poly-beta-1,6-N-acetylglucosamine synthase-like glycosyltransferase
MTALASLGSTLFAVQWAFLAYFLLVNGMLSLLLASALLQMRRHLHEVWQEDKLRLLSSELVPIISILVPAHDEALTVSESVRSLLTLRYPSLEVIVVNDGSTDRTLEVLARDFDLMEMPALFDPSIGTAPVRGLHRSRGNPSLVVVDKDNGGKADALNAALNVATGELVCAIDSDTIVEADALLRMVRPFLAAPEVIAAGGMIRVANGSDVRSGRVVRQRAPRALLPALQAVEYERAFLAGRLGWNGLGGNVIVSGAFGLFRRATMLAAGGYLPSTVGEDMELVARLRRIAIQQGSGDRVTFLPDAVAWTEVPRRLGALAGQRDRWQRGLAEVLWGHRRMIGNPRYRALGMFVMPYYLLVELLAPLVELTGLLTLVAGLVLGALHAGFALLFLALAYGFGVVLTLATLAFEEWTYRAYGGFGDRLALAAFSILEGFGYRQLTALWRVRGMSRWLRGRTDWGVMTREGFGPPPQVEVR